MVTRRLKDKLHGSFYFFLYLLIHLRLWTSYIGRCSRNFYFRAPEYLQVQLSKDIVNTVNIWILSYLVQTDHTSNNEQSFTVIYRVNSYLSKPIRLRILHMTEPTKSYSDHQTGALVTEAKCSTVFCSWPTSGSIS